MKARWIDPSPGGNKIMQREFRNPFTNEMISWNWCFIPSKVTDNAYLEADYIARLQQTGSEQLVKAWLEGDWDAVEGAYFDEWDEDRHVIPASAVNIADLDGLFFRAIDWGYASPFSVGWWCHLRSDLRLDLPGGVRTYPSGALLRIQEWYGKGLRTNEGLRLPVDTLARGVLKRDPLNKEDIAYTVMDPSAFSEDGGPSQAERMAKEGLITRKADNKRVGTLGHIGGWDQMRGRLRGDSNGNPMIACLDTCLHSIRTIPVLQHDPDRPEDLDTEQEDHAADEWRYACMSRPYNKSPDEEEKKRPDFDYIQKKQDDSMDWVTW